MTTAALTIRVALAGPEGRLQALGESIRSADTGADGLQAVLSWLQDPASHSQELTPDGDGWRAVGMYASHPQWPGRCDGNIVLDILEWRDQTPRRKPAAAIAVPQPAEEQPEEPQPEWQQPEERQPADPADNEEGGTP